MYGFLVQNELENIYIVEENLLRQNFELSENIYLAQEEDHSPINGSVMRIS